MLGGGGQWCVLASPDLKIPINMTLWWKWGNTSIDFCITIVNRFGQQKNMG